jgi:hypothetical protein
MSANAPIDAAKQAVAENIKNVSDQRSRIASLESGANIPRQRIVEARNALREMLVALEDSLQQLRILEIAAGLRCAGEYTDDLRDEALPRKAE